MCPKSPAAPSPSPAAGYINGQTVIVDGGLLAS